MDEARREQRISWIESRLHTLQGAVLYSRNRKSARNEQARLQAELKELQSPARSRLTHREPRQLDGDPS